MNNTISPLINEQLPEFIKSDFSDFGKFLEKYYEWMEQDNNPYQVLDSILKYQDVDDNILLDTFIQYFKTEYLIDIPASALSNKALLIKNIREFYRSRGTEDSFKLLFRILFDVDLNFYYPKEDIFKVSSGKWIQYKEIVVSLIDGDISDFESSILTASTSSTVLHVEKVLHYNDDIYVLYVDPNKFFGTLIKDEILRTANSQTTVKVKQHLVGWEIVNPKYGYKVGDTFDIKEDDGLDGGQQFQTGGNAGFGYNTLYDGIVTDVARGSVDDYTIANGGGDGITKYQVGDKIEFDETGTNGSGVFMLVSAVDVDGRITEVNIKSKGKYYTSLPAFKQITRNGEVIDGTAKVYAKTTTIGAIKSLEMMKIIFENPDYDWMISHIAGDGMQSGDFIPIMGLVTQHNGSYSDDGGKLSSNKKIQDGDYYQDFSYVLKSSISINQFESVLNNLLHPAGMIFKNHIYNLGIVYDEESASSTNLTIDTITGVPVNQTRANERVIVINKNELVKCTDILMNDLIIMTIKDNFDVLFGPQYSTIEEMKFHYNPENHNDKDLNSYEVFTINVTDGNISNLLDAEISSGTSGATGNVVSIDPATNRIVVNVTTGGPFQSGEEIVATGIKGIVVDNLDENNIIVGNWPQSATSGYFRDNSVFCAENGGKFTFVKDMTGTHEIFMWWVDYPNRADEVDIKIYDNDTLLDTVTVNQQINGHQWMSLGTYTFNTGPIKITLTSAGPLNIGDYPIVYANTTQEIPMRAQPLVMTNDARIEQIVFYQDEAPLSIVGNDTIMGSQTGTYIRRAQPVVMTEEGTIDSITFHHDAKGTGIQGMLAVYANDDTYSNDYPGTLLTETEITEITNATEWQTIELKDKIFVENGTKIWLAWVFDASVDLKFEAAATIAEGRATTPNGHFEDGFPEYFGAPTEGGGEVEVAQWKYSIYANYQSKHVQLALYDNIENVTIKSSGGDYLGDAPNNKLSETLKVPARTSENWYTVNLQTPVWKASGSKIWAAWVWDDNPGIKYYIDDGNPELCRMNIFNNTEDIYDGFPDIWHDPERGSNARYSINVRCGNVISADAVCISPVTEADVLEAPKNISYSTENGNDVYETHHSNTQINNIKDISIDDIMNEPNNKTNLCPNSDTTIFTVS